MSPETRFFNQNDRPKLVRRIGRLASRLSVQDPEIFAMLTVSKSQGRAPIGQSGHLDNMMAVQWELVTNTIDTEDDAESLIWDYIQKKVAPQLEQLRGFGVGWHYRSRPFREAFEDVAALQAKYFKQERPPKGVIIAESRRRAAMAEQ